MGYTNLSFYRSKMMGTPNRMTTRPTGKRLKSSTEPTSCRFERSKIDSLLSKKWEILGYATTCFLLITMLAPVDATNQFQRDMETHGIRRRLHDKSKKNCPCGKAIPQWLTFGLNKKGGQCNQCEASPCHICFGTRKDKAGYACATCDGLGNESRTCSGFPCSMCEKQHIPAGRFKLLGCLKCRWAACPPCVTQPKISPSPKIILSYPCGKATRKKLRYQTCGSTTGCKGKRTKDWSCSKCHASWLGKMAGASFYCTVCKKQNVTIKDGEFTNTDKSWVMLICRKCEFWCCMDCIHSKETPLPKNNVNCSCKKAKRRTTYKQCGKCTGTGVTGWYWKKKCRACYGTGENIFYYGCDVCSTASKRLFQAKDECPKCNGTGNNCDACVGTGIAMMLECVGCKWHACPDCMVKTVKEAKEEQDRLKAGKLAEKQKRDKVHQELLQKFRGGNDELLV